MQELFLGEQSLQDEPPELWQQAQVRQEETQHCTQPVELHQAGAQMGVNTFQKVFMKSMTMTFQRCWWKVWPW